jgi:hypothetical protein
MGHSYFGIQVVSQAAEESAAAAQVLTSRCNHWICLPALSHERRVLDGVMNGGMNTGPLDVEFGQQ